MNSEFNTTEQSLEKLSVERLSLTERDRLWEKISYKHATHPVPSPYSVMLLKQSHRLIFSTLLLIVLIAGGGTVIASDGAKPGDTLFALDRVVEKVHLALTPEEKQPEIKLAFAEERLTELDEIISEESSKRLAVAPTTQEPVSAKVSTFAEIEDADVVVEDAAARFEVAAEPAISALKTKTVSTDLLPKESISKISKGIENSIATLEAAADSFAVSDSSKDRNATIQYAVERIEERLEELPDTDRETFAVRLAKIREEQKVTEEENDETVSEDACEAIYTSEQQQELQKLNTEEVGEQFGFIREIYHEDKEFSIEFDSADLLTQSKDTCSQDETSVFGSRKVSKKICGPNGFLIENEDIKNTQIFGDPEIIDIVSYEILPGCGQPTLERVSLEELENRIQTDAFEETGIPVQILLQDGKVIRIREQYIP